MKAEQLTPHLRRCSLLLAFTVALAARGEPVPPDLSGSYDDEGVLFSDGAEKFKGIVSLRALLTLEFDPAHAQQLHEQTARIAMHQKDGVLDILAYDYEDNVSKLGRWSKGPDYAELTDRVALRLRAREETYVFTLEIAGNGKLLRLTVLRGKATLFGPMGQAVGVFLFARRPER